MISRVRVTHDPQRASKAATSMRIAGEAFTAKNVRIIRPGYGLAPKHLDDILGRRAKRALQRGTRMSWDLLE